MAARWEKKIKGQGPGLVNVLWGDVHMTQVFTAPRCPRGVPGEMPEARERISPGSRYCPRDRYCPRCPRCRAR